jgi:hypothetical protein
MDSSLHIQRRIARSLFYNHTARMNLIAGGCGSPSVIGIGSGVPMGLVANMAIGALSTSATEYDDILDTNKCPVVGANYNAPFTPNEIPSLSMWLDASNAGDFVINGDGVVTRWNDKSGLGNNMSVPAGQQGPVRDVDGDDNPYVGFNSKVLAANNIINSADFSVFFVGTYISNAGMGDHYVLASMNKLRVNANNIVYTVPTGPALNIPYLYNAGVSKLFSVVARSNADGTALSAGINGAITTVSSPVENVVDDAGFVLGARSTDGGSTFGQYGNVRVSEVIAYKNNLLPAEREKVEGYLANKWGLTLPEDHPWFAVAP